VAEWIGSHGFIHGGQGDGVHVLVGLRGLASRGALMGFCPEVGTGTLGGYGWMAWRVCC
jgi:hypothetical protein